MRNAVTSIALSLCLAACSDAPVAFDDYLNPPVGTGEEFRLGVGDHVRIGDGNLYLWFEAVPEDSRCATGVTCVWEGNARARLLLRGDGRDEYVELNTSNRFDRQRQLAVGTLELRGLDPHPPVGDPKRYVVTLYVEPAP